MTVDLRQLAAEAIAARDYGEGLRDDATPVDGDRDRADAVLAAVVPVIRAQVAEEIAAAIGAAKPDLTCTEVDTRVHGIRPGQYLDVNHAWRIAQDHAAPREENEHREV